MPAPLTDLRRPWQRAGLVLEALPLGSLRREVLALLVDRDRTALELVREIYGERQIGARRLALSNVVRWLRKDLASVGLVLEIEGQGARALWRLRFKDNEGAVPTHRPPRALRHAARRVDLDLSAVTDAQALRARLAAAVRDLRPGRLLVFHCSAERPGALLRPAAAEVARQMGLALRQWPEDPAEVSARRWSLALECPARSRPGASAKTLGEVAR